MNFLARPRVTFYFLHLLGVGHVYRSMRLIESIAAKNIAVDIIYGGERIDGLSFAAETVSYLPPIRSADSSYSTYLDGLGRPLSEPYLTERQDELLSIFSKLSSDMILFEAFPFGRRMVRHEIGALLNAAKLLEHPPLIVSSVRDILQERKKPGRHEEVRDLVNGRFDHILVHSDPHLIPLDATFPLASEIAAKISYTGFVIPPEPTTASATQIDQTYDIVVSAGGGAFGGGLMSTALELAKQNPFPGWRWCLATGPNLESESFDSLTSQAPSHVSVVRRLDHLAQHMKRAKLSISQCGYNTAMDALSAQLDSQCRIVFVPFDTDGQTEQLKRSELLQDSGHAVTVPQSKLTVQSLNNSANKALESTPSNLDINFDGAATTANLVLQWLSQRSSQ